MGREKEAEKIYKATFVRMTAVHTVALLMSWLMTVPQLIPALLGVGT